MRRGAAPHAACPRLTRTKDLDHAADALGNMISSPETIAAGPGWTPDAQLRLAAEVLAPELEQDAATLLEQVMDGFDWSLA